MSFQFKTKWRGGRLTAREEIDPDEIFIDSSNIPNFDRNSLQGNLEKSLGKGSGTGLIAIALIVILIFEQILCY